MLSFTTAYLTNGNFSPNCCCNSRTTLYRPYRLSSLTNCPVNQLFEVTFVLKKKLYNITRPHNHMTEIWALWNQQKFTTIAVSCSHMTIICTYHSWLTTSSVNGETGSKISSHSHVMSQLTIAGDLLNDHSRTKVVGLLGSPDILFNNCVP